MFAELALSVDHGDFTMMSQLLPVGHNTGISMNIVCYFAFSDLLIASLKLRV